MAAVLSRLNGVVGKQPLIVHSQFPSILECASPRELVE